MFDEHFFLALAFTAFAAVFIKYCLPLLIKSVDAKSQQIADEINAARKMKEEAQKLLTAAENYLQESEKFANKVIKDAESESLKIIEEAKKTLALEISKKTSATMNRLKTEEEAALRSVKERIIEAAIQNAYSNLAQELNEKNHETIVEKSVQDLSKSS